MSKSRMRGHFRYLRFKTFPMKSRKPQCEVFWALLSNSKHSGVPKDSKSSLFPSVGLHPHTWPKCGCDSLPLGLVDSHGKCEPQWELSPAKSKRHPFCVRGSDVEAGNENAPALVRSYGNLSINYVLHQLHHNKLSAICKAARHIPQQNHRAAFLQGQSVGWHP